MVIARDPKPAATTTPDVHKTQKTPGQPNDPPLRLRREQGVISPEGG